MNFISVCSGIEAASVAWNPLGWKAVGFSEIEPFPCAVLAHHYPDVPNYGDLTKWKEWGIERGSVDLICGGTPCQSFSVAGLRKGLDDPRGNLMLTFLALVDEVRPRWVVWENVPGVLSSNGGRDFGTFLGGLGQLGYGWAFRVLDAQYVRVDGFERAVPQRRRRVFVVGCLGDQAGAAAVLFEQNCMCGNPPPGRKAGKGFAASVVPSLTASGRGVERAGETRGQDPVVAVPGRKWPADCASTLNAHFGDKQGLEDQHALHGAELFVSDTCGVITAGISKGPRGTEAVDSDQLVCAPILGNSYADNASEESKLVCCAKVSPTMTRGGAPFERTGNERTECEAIVAIRTDQTGSNGSGFNYSGAAHTLDQANGQAVAFGGDIARTLNARHDSSPCADRGMDVVAQSMSVRRLTPTECERLMGFKDNYTAIPWRNKPAELCPDGPRYKALGNSWAINSARWVGTRIQMVEDCK